MELQPAACRLIELKRGEKPLAFRSKGDVFDVLLVVFDGFFLAVEIDDFGFFLFLDER